MSTKWRPGSSEAKAQFLVREDRPFGGIHFPATLCWEVLADREPLIDLEPHCPHCLLLSELRIFVSVQDYPNSAILISFLCFWKIQESRTWTSRPGLGHPLTLLSLSCSSHCLID